MADKQIIINGCDVSGCDFYDKNEKYCLTLKMNTTGFKNPSCFSGDFQECIQDSNVCPNTFCDNNHNCYYKQLQQLKAENEELKKQLQEESNLGHKAVQEEADSLFEALKYKKALDEIEEIVNNFANEDIITLPDLPKEKNYKFIAEQYAEPIIQILQKIKEVKGNG